MDKIVMDKNDSCFNAAKFIFVILPVLILFSAQGQSIKEGRKNTECSIKAEALKCENQNDPLGIDAVQPRLTWELTAHDNERNQYQTAFRIQVASSKDLLLSGKPDLWDSNIVDTSLSNNILYQGKKLKSKTPYYWRVKVWDNYHITSPWSKIAFWEMGLLNPSDWNGDWIEEATLHPLKQNDLYNNAAPLFRRDFRSTKKIQKARMYVSGLGYYEAYINGKKVGNKLLDPGWTDYSKRILYSTYDVTPYLTKGENCVGMLLGNGWYNPLPLKMWGRINIRESLPVGQPKFIMQLDIEYMDGDKTQIVSDENWKCTSGPIIQNSIYLGETCDARKEIPGWNESGSNTTLWEAAKRAAPPAGKLQSPQQPPIVVTDTLRPVNIKKNNGKYIVDFGRNFAGVIRIKLEGEPGTIVKVRYGELLYPDGSLNVMTSTAGQIKRKGVGGAGAPDTAYARDIFILNGKGTETFQPHFTFHGFRYAEVTGYPGTLQKNDIVGLPLCAKVPDVGKFSCSDSLINKIQNTCLNTFRSNLFSVQSDCPHRERFGYGGDIVATCDAFMMNFDMAGFYQKTVNDFADEAQPDGGLTETAPFVGIAGDGLSGKSGPVEWGAVLPVLLWKLHQYYGSMEIIRENYSAAKNWVDFMHRHARENIISTTIGDHESIDPKLTDLSATAFYYYNTSLLSKFSKMLGRQEDFNKYETLKDSIKTAFLQKFFDPSTCNIGIHTAAAQAYGLYFQLIPDSAFDRVLTVMLNDISLSDHHITSGIFGTNFLMEVLGQTGNSSIGYKMITQETSPGWGYMIANGATTLWEHWALDENTYSHNHPMFGSISNWFYKYIGGIGPCEDAVGYNKIVIEPGGIRNLQWAKASYHSVLGKISSSWKKNGSGFTFDVTIPVNATATVYLPSFLKNIREGNIPVVGKVSHSTFTKDDKTEIQLGSGTYHFTATISQ